MSEHIDNDDEGHGGSHDEPWLVSYADMMTLLFGFFVVMYSFAAAKLQDNTVQMRAEVATYFGGGVINPLEESMNKFMDVVKSDGANSLDNINIKVFPEGAEVSFQSKALFDSGSADLSAQAHKMIKLLIEEVKRKGSTDWDIVVEGHTDDAPIIYSKVYPSNWELSAARASTVFRMFEQEGFQKSNLKAIGYADSRPLVPNRDENGKPIALNMDKNRRIMIKISMTDAAQIEASEQRGL